MVTLSEPKLFRVIYNPNPLFTLQDIGIIDENIMLTSEEVGGLLSAGTAVFGDSVGSHLRIFFIGSDILEEYFWRDFEETDMLVYKSKRNLKWDKGVSVESYVRRLAALDHTIPKTEFSKDYYARIKSKDGFSIVQFNSIGFIERFTGLITRLNLNPVLYIDHYYIS